MVRIASVSFGRIVEALINGAIVIAALTLVTVAARAHYRPPIRTSQPDLPKVGTRIDLAGISWTDARASVVLALPCSQSNFVGTKGVYCDSPYVVIEGTVTPYVETFMGGCCGCQSCVPSGQYGTNCTF